jgi:predicted kinase
MGEAVYARLLKLTRALVDNGETVIVDATFLSHADRVAFQSMARKSERECVIVQCEAPRDCLAQRVVDRIATKADPSEATLEVLDRQLQLFESPRAGERTIRVRTDKEVDVAKLVGQILALPSSS